uniref:E3 ubiquitin-protein ligase RMA n=1 Tax=Oryza punctata TaxID=4537 RepID=A0A0E0LRJ5_ORYPU
MAAESSAAGGGERRGPMDLNLYLGLPPLPPPPGRLDVAADYPSLLLNSAAVANEQRGSVVVAPPPPPPPPAYSPSNALSAPEQVLVDPVAAWLVDPGEQQAVPPIETPSYMARASSTLPQIFACAALEMLVQSGRAIPPTGLIRGAEIAAASRPMTPENRLRRLIQVSDQHGVGNGRAGPGPVSRSRRANSPEAGNLAQAIQRSHNSLEASRRQKLDGDGKVGGSDAAKKDDGCGCNGSFECNICFESAKEPVVTPCGHLFCWPCIYQWLHGHSEHSDCPVCKGEVLEAKVTPIYGRGGGEENSSRNGIQIPPRPSAQRTESLRQQLQRPDTRGGITNMVRRLMQNQDIVAGQAASSAGVERTRASAPRPRARGRRQARQGAPSAPATQQQVVNADTGSGNQAPLPPPDANDAAPAVAVAPQQSSSVEQASTSSTVGVIAGGPAQASATTPSQRLTAQAAWVDV